MYITVWYEQISLKLGMLGLDIFYVQKEKFFFTVICCYNVMNLHLGILTKYKWTQPPSLP